MNKKELLNILKIKTEEKINSLENLIVETRASNNDTKSSMGDKYETSREMLQQEINNLQRQLNECIKQQNLLLKMNTESCDKVQKGALVKTDKGMFYIAVSLGELKLDSTKIMSISEDSPLAKAMFGMKVGSNFTINTIQHHLDEIW